MFPPNVPKGMPPSSAWACPWLPRWVFGLNVPSKARSEWAVAFLSIFYLLESFPLPWVLKTDPNPSPFYYWIFLVFSKAACVIDILLSMTYSGSRPKLNYFTIYSVPLGFALKMFFYLFPFLPLPDIYEAPLADDWPSLRSFSSRVLHILPIIIIYYK